MIKPFCGFLPVPILPAAQVAATSYEQHLAYIEWYIKQLYEDMTASDETINTLGDTVGSLGETLSALQTTVGNIPVVKANEALAGTEADLTELTVDNIKYKIPEGGSGSDITYASGDCSVIVGAVTVSGAKWERIGNKVFVYLPGLGDAMAVTGQTTFSLFALGTDFPAIKTEEIRLIDIYSATTVYLLQATVSGSGSTLLFSNIKVLSQTVGSWTDQSSSFAYYLQYFTPVTLTLTVDD